MLKMSRYLVFLTVFSLCYVDSKATSNCEQKVSMTYLDAAVDMISKAKINIPASCEGNLTRGAMDCSDLLHMGYNKSGAYTIWPVSRINEDKPLEVYCDMETDGGGWTLIQRRGNFGKPIDYFFRDWQTYREGFGDIEKDFWLGNDKIFALSNQRLYSVRFDLKDIENSSRYAHYGAFWIDHESYKYTLHIADYSGNAGESMIAHHNNQKFSTKDQDNDPEKERDCANQHKGGWWYGPGCHLANLNGLYLRGKHEGRTDGMNWQTWKSHFESMESTEIKIRPKKFSLSHVSLNTPM